MSSSESNSNISVLFLEPFYGGSHKQLIDLLVKDPRLCQSSLVTLKAKKWHWRARCSAIIFQNLIPKVRNESVLFCSGVLNLAELLGMRSDLQRLKKIVYFHENQMIYPVKEIKERDVQYAYNQIVTCLAADIVVFNSNFNRHSFLDNIPRIIKLLPDYRPKNLLQIIESKSSVLYFPIEYPIIRGDIAKSEILHIVWPHRWEFDKNPEGFFEVLLRLKEGGHKFCVSVLGECFQEVPVVFENVRITLEQEILNFGYIENKQNYYKILSEAHVVVSTAKHEFFGVAMLEAVYCGCYPLVPNRLVYPEIYPKDCLYDSSADLFNRLKAFVLEPSQATFSRKRMDIDLAKYSAERLLPEYLKILSSS